MALRDALLLLLAEGTRHGYELKTEFERRTASIWPVNTGQVYTTLERLQRDGLVEPTAADERADNGEHGRSRHDRRRPYRLTDDGRTEARAWLADEDTGAPPRDELIMKVLLAAHSDLGEAQAVIDGLRHRLLARLQRIRERQRRAPDTLAARLCSDALTVRIEADLRWLDLCTERLAAEAAATGATGRPGSPASTTTPERARGSRGKR
jgi:DNA-binding PadR family transcriptional regulator